MTDKFISTFADASAINLWEYVQNHLETINSAPPVSLGDRFLSLENVLVATKLLMPTLWNCNYFLWDIWKGLHHGIDIIMPLWTPIISFCDWQVVKAEKRWWYGNFVVVKSEENLFFCYEHLSEIKVQVNDKVKFGDVIGLCWSTWNSTQYHLHFQIDKDNAPFHPFWSNKTENISKYTVNPIQKLRQVYNIDEKNSVSNENNSTVNNSSDTDFLDELINKLDEETKKTDTSDETIFKDMPSDKVYAEAIKNLYEKGILKWDNWYIYPDHTIIRYAFALLLYRIIKQLNLIDNPKTINKINFEDVNLDDKEFAEALKFLVANNIMKWDNKLFYPWQPLYWEQLLAVLWRLFWNLSDNLEGVWYKPYYDRFVAEKIIDKNWPYIYKPVVRKEVFRIIYRLILND